MTSFIAACGLGRSTSFIPAVPAAWSLTTIAFMIIFSSVILAVVPAKRDGSGSLRSLVLANRCVVPGHKTVPRVPILAVPSRDGGPPHPTRSCQKDSLTAQIYSAIREGIENGRLASGARLPSWQDLAAQLGVSRGTVRVAYERLIAEQFAVGLGPAGRWPSGSPDPQYLIGRLKPRFCRTSSTSSETRRWHFRWACPLKTPFHSSYGHAS